MAKEKTEAQENNKKDVSRAVEKMLKKAYAELGYTERSDGYTKFGEWYGKGFSKLDWCAMFVNWVCYQGFGDKYTDYIARTATADLPKQTVDAKKGEWVKAPGGKVKTTPQPGDIWATGSGKWFQHTGMVYSVDDKNKQIITIEGNCSNKVSSIKRSYDSLKCIARPKWGKVGNISDATTELDLSASIALLYSSDNYKYIEKEDDQEVQRLKNIQDTIYKNLTNIKGDEYTTTGALTEGAYEVVKGAMESLVAPATKAKEVKASKLLSYQNFVEAPTVSVMFNGMYVGGYGNVGDKYPNYFQSMSVQKINGKINQYTINLKYQVRPGEDPNFIDKLLSKTGYQNQVKILYGDSATGYSLFREEDAIITGCSYSEDVASSSISYTITALSASTILSNKNATYATITSKPSTVLRDLLYSSGAVSQALLTTFPGMVSRLAVDAANLIPTNDAEVTIGGMKDVDIITYIKHVVACMTNVDDTIKSSYYLSFIDDVSGELGGSYFKITELQAGVNEASVNNNALYTLDVGYPGDNFITNFEINSDSYWPMIYEYNGNIPRYTYEVDNLGNIVENINSSVVLDHRQNADIGKSNWWVDMTEFPVQAKITLKGVTKPVMLMSYVIINCVFYGVKDIASGLYVVTNQEDSISGNGCTTTLSLLRLSEETV